MAEDEDGTDLTDEVQVDTSRINRAGEQQIIYTVKGITVLEEAGLLCAVTTENGKCYPG